MANNVNKLNALDYFLMFMLVALLTASTVHIYYNVPHLDIQVPQ